MGKIKIFLGVALLFCFNCVVHGQNIQVLYEETFTDIHTINNVDVPDEIAKMIENKNKKTLYVLDYSNGESIYRRYDENKLLKSDENMKIEQNSVGNNSEVYKNFDTKEILRKNELNGKKYLIENEVLYPELQPISETKIILGHKCVGQRTEIKAEVNSKIITGHTTFWYCPDIQINDGPSLHCGLPGLILQVESPISVITATKINEDADLKITRPTEGMHITQKEFNDLLKEQLKNFGMDGSSGSFIKTTKF